MNVAPEFRAANSRYSDADLLAAIETAAEMVEVLGEVVLPLFERLEQEYYRRQSMQSALDRAAAILQNGRIRMLG